MSTRNGNPIDTLCTGRSLVPLVLGLFAFALPTANVAAHGPEIMRESEPPDGSMLAQSPDRVTLRFDTELSTTESMLQVFDGEGRQVDDGHGGVDLNDPEHGSLTVVLPALSPGAYTVHWRAAVFEDDDVVEGQSTFTVGMMKNAGMSHEGMSHEGMSHEHMSHEGMSMASATMPADIDTATTQPSEHGQYRVSFTSNLEPIAINQMHSWLLHVETVDGQPVDDAAITVGGGMPEHNHGLPTAPKVTKHLGHGDYLVEGMKFHMNGWWEVTLGITNGHESDDSVTFNLLL